MKITVLGNNSALPAFGRHPTAQAVEVHGTVLLIDCGEGTQIQMQRYSIKWRKLNHIFISHLHGDHYFGLPGLINSMSLQGRTEPLHLYAPAPLKNIIDQILQVADTTLAFPFHFHELPEGGDAILVDNFYFSVQCFPVIHRINCHGFVITAKNKGRKILPELCAEHGIPTHFYLNLKNGEDYTDPTGKTVRNDWVTEDGPAPKRYAYCADTIFTDTYLPFIRNTDAIYHESTYLQEDEAKAIARYHCTSVQAAQIAAMANTKLLLLGHFSSKYKDLSEFKTEAATVFPNVVVTVEGMFYEV